MENLIEIRIMTHQPSLSTAVIKLINDLQSTDDTIRSAAWQGAAPSGAPAVKPLAGVMTDADFETARAAKRALWKIVRFVGRPKAGKERKAVQSELISVLQTAPTPVRREVVWMLSEVGDAGSVEALSALLVEVDVREDARCALERIPGSKATRALEVALTTVPEDFRPAVANSLRVRGRKVDSYPSQKFVPTKATAVGAK
jgi:HEAT repeat protein